MTVTTEFAGEPVPAPRRRGGVSLGVPAEYEAVLAGYRVTLERAGISEHTRRAYASRVSGFLRWLADTSLPKGGHGVGDPVGADPLADAWARDFVVRDYRAWLLAVAKKSSNTVNAHLTAVDGLYTHLGLGPANADRIDLPRQAPRALAEDETRRLLRGAERLSSIRDKTIVTWRAGIDVLSFGATKNGAMTADALVVFDRSLTGQLEYRTKRAGQLTSKMRFQAAQLDAYLTDNLWLRNAAHANAMAARLTDGLRAIPAIRLCGTPEANIVFANIPAAVTQDLLNQGFSFYHDRWAPETVRFVTSFTTTNKDIDDLIHAIGTSAGS